MYLEERLIAMLDVLGFSNQIGSREGIVDILDTYTRMIAHARERILTARSSDEVNRDLDAPAFASAEFVFDTLVLVSLPLNTVNVGAYIGAICSLMSYFAVNNMPLRGAIGIGDYASDEKGPGTRISVSTISKVLNHAEQQQQWSGCYILPKFEAQILDHLGEPARSGDLSQSSALFRCRVPRKNNDHLDAYCLNWMAGLSEGDASNLLSFMSGDPEKRENTRSFIDFYRTLPRVLYPLPANFSPAASATVLRSGKGVQIHFWDKDGQGATSMGCKHVVYDPRQPAENAFRGYDTDDEEAALRW